MFAVTDSGLRENMKSICLLTALFLLGLPLSGPAADQPETGKIPVRQEGLFPFPPEIEKGWVFYDSKQLDIIPTMPGKETVKAWNRGDFQLVAIYFVGEENPCYYWIYDQIFGRTLTCRVDADNDRNFEYHMSGSGSFDLGEIYTGWGRKHDTVRRQKNLPAEFIAATAACSKGQSGDTGRLVRVKNRILNLRATPTTGSSVVARLHGNALLRVLSEKNGWYEVIDRNCRQGWVAGYLTMTVADQ